MSAASGDRGGGGAAGRGNDTQLYRSVSTGLLLSGGAAQGVAGMVPATSSMGVQSLGALADSHSKAAVADQHAIQMRPLLASSKYKYSRLNLTINELGEHEEGSPIVKEKRKVSMFWEEKLAMLLFYLQCHALIWLQCYEFYPHNWREYWRWTLVFILDIANLIKDAGGPDSGGDTAAHTFCIMLLPLVSVAIYEYLVRTVYADRIAGSISEDRHRVSFLRFQKWSLLYAEQLYVPLALLFFRVWTCGSNNEVIFIYRNWQCWSGGHIVILLFIAAITLPCCFLLPYRIYKRCKPIIVFHDAAMHERYLQSRELEYIMGCNNLYEYTHFQYIGSFKRFWAYNRLFQLVQRFLLCLFLVALNQYNAGSNALIWQSLCFLLIICAPPFLNFGYRTYRCPSSNWLKAIFDSVMFFTCVLNVIESNPSGFSSSFIDPYTFSDMMLLVNLVGLGMAGVLCAYHRFQETRPKHRGLDLYWPVKETDLLALHEAHPEMIAALNAGKRLVEEAALTPEEFYPRQNLLEAIHAMRTLLAEAKARREGKGRRSALDDRVGARGKRPAHRQLSTAEEAELLRVLRLGEEKSRALEWTLQDMVEDLALLYNTISARVAKGGVANGTTSGSAAAAAEQAKEAARFERMQQAFVGFAESLRHKGHERTLMHPYKRDFLAKLLAIKGIVSAVNENFVYGDRPPWEKPSFLPPLEQPEPEEELPVTPAVAAFIAEHQQSQRRPNGAEPVPDIAINIEAPVRRTGSAQSQNPAQRLASPPSERESESSDDE